MSSSMFAVLLFIVMGFVLGLWFLRHTVNVAETVIDKVSDSDSISCEEERTLSDELNSQAGEDAAQVQ